MTAPASRPDLRLLRSAPPAVQSPRKTPAPAAFLEKRTAQSRSAATRGCLQLRREKWGGGVGSAHSSHPGTRSASSPRASAWVAPPCPAHAPSNAERRASLSFSRVPAVAVPGFGCGAQPPGEGEEENCNELRGTVSIPGSPPPEVSFKCSLHGRLAPACSAAEGASVSGFHSPFSQSEDKMREVKEISRFHSPLSARSASLSCTPRLFDRPTRVLITRPLFYSQSPSAQEGAALGIQAAVALAVERNRVGSLGPSLSAGPF